MSKRNIQRFIEGFIKIFKSNNKCFKKALSEAVNIYYLGQINEPWQKAILSKSISTFYKEYQEEEDIKIDNTDL